MFSIHNVKSETVLYNFSNFYPNPNLDTNYDTIQN